MISLSKVKVHMHYAKVVKKFLLSLSGKARFINKKGQVF
jgi:hypothetical protein